MNFGDLKSYARSRYKEASSSDVTDTTMLKIYNEGAMEIARYARLLPTSTQFDIVAEQDEYLISTVADDFLTMHESGLWINNNTVASPSWDDLWESTIKSLDMERPSWRDEDSGTPKYYVIEQNIITIFPTPSSSLTNGLWLYYYKHPTAMSSNDDYPFGDVEIPHFRIFDEVLFKYYKFRASEILRKSVQEIKAEEADFYNELQRKMSLKDERLDLSRRRRTRIRAGWIPKSY